MKDSSEIGKTVKDIISSMKKMDDRLQKILKNKKVLITGNYNGQPYGSSAKSLKGTTQTVRGCLYDRYIGAQLFLEDKRLAIELSNVEFIDEEK